MATHRTRKSKQNANYNFIFNNAYTWEPREARVNRETVSAKDLRVVRLSASKKADNQAKHDSVRRIRKDLIKSLIIVAFVLTLELVVYLARYKFNLP